MADDREETWRSKDGLIVPILSDDFVAEARARTLTKRARHLLEKLIEHGSYSNDDLQGDNYQDGASVRRDLNDAGVDVVTVTRPSVRQPGASTGTYYLRGTIVKGKATRRSIPAKFARELKAHFDYTCQVCDGVYPESKLQPDHRVPFGVGGDRLPFSIDDFMPLCGRDNRAKSYTCERCPNYQILDVETCRTCYWANPQGGYTHSETLPERRVTVTFQDADIDAYDELQKRAQVNGESVSELVKRILTD